MLLEEFMDRVGSDGATCSVGGDGLGLHLDTADTVAIDDGELDVALVTPGGVPGVLNQPVVQSGSGVVTPADSEDGVIESGSAFSGVEDTAGVGLEHVLVGLNGDGKRLGGKGGLHLVDVACSDESIVGNVDSGGAGRIVVASGNLAGSR